MYLIKLSMKQHILSKKREVLLPNILYRGNKRVCDLHLQRSLEIATITLLYSTITLLYSTNEFIRFTTMMSNIISETMDSLVLNLSVLLLG